MRTVDPVKYQQKRQDILRAARRCFEQGGFQSTSISKVCAEAKISAGHLYHYFENKEDILGSIVEDVLLQAAEHLALALEDGDPILLINALIDQITGIKEGVQYSLIFDLFSGASRNLELAAILQKNSQDMIQLLAKVLREGQLRGQVRSPLDTDTAAIILIGLIDGTKSMTLRTPSLDRQKIISMLHEMVANLLAPRG